MFHGQIQLFPSETSAVYRPSSFAGAQSISNTRLRSGALSDAENRAVIVHPVHMRFLPETSSRGGSLTLSDKEMETMRLLGRATGEVKQAPPPAYQT